MRYLLTILLVCTAFASCKSKDCTFSPQSGDLLFCVAEQSAMSDAIVDATSTGDNTRFDHVAIFAIINGEAKVIEASTKDGVVCRDWEAFREESKNGIVVKRTNCVINIHKAIKRATSLIGQPYDWSYLPNNGKVYCSELIYDCYLTEDGKPVFTAKPMNFRDADGNLPQFWIDLFNKLDEPVPEGVPGTNPNDMSKENILTEVYRYKTD